MASSVESTKRKLEELEEDKEEGGGLNNNKKQKKLSPMLSAIIECIRSHKKFGGTSSVRITGDLKTVFSEKAIKKALLQGVQSGHLIKNKNSFEVAGDPPIEDTSEKITVQEVSPGIGERVVVSGDRVVIAYKGRLLGGPEFDKGNNFSFQVGAGEVVKGMDAGVLGMKVDGHRVIVIPPSLGYGKRGSAPDIPGNSTLSFEISLKAIH